MITSSAVGATMTESLNNLVGLLDAVISSLRDIAQNTTVKAAEQAFVTAFHIFLTCNNARSMRR